MIFYHHSPWSHLIYLVLLSQMILFLNRPGKVTEVWDGLSEAGKLRFIICRDARGYNILMTAGCWGMKETMNTLLELFYSYDRVVWDDILMPACSNGNTFITNAVVHQYTDELIEVLKKYPMEGRRRLLTVPNKAGYSPRDIAQVPLGKLRDKAPKYLHTINGTLGTDCDEVCHNILSFIHVLTNEYYMGPVFWKPVMYRQVGTSEFGTNFIVIGEA